MNINCICVQLHGKLKSLLHRSYGDRDVDVCEGGDGVGVAMVMVMVMLMVIVMVMVMVMMIMTMMCRGIVELHFRYCCSVWGNCGVTRLQTLQKLQNRAARIVKRSNFESSA